MPTATELFFAALHEHKSPEHFILLWSGKSKTSWWCQTTTRAARLALRNPSDMYVGCALTPDPAAIGDPKVPISSKRCTADQISGICALWLDVDIKHPQAHTRADLPPDLESALALVKHQGWDPSIIVHSGFGLHCWWILKEHWQFNGNNDRFQAGRLEEALVRHFQAKAKKSGWWLDSVHNMDRILRIPGTLNCKLEGNPQHVTLLDINAARYDPAEIAEWLDVELEPANHAGVSELPDTAQTAAPAEPAAPKPPADIKQITGALDFNPKPSLDVDRFNELKEAFDPKFTLTWQKNRSDFKAESPSEYDYSLAHFAVICGWSDQEILDLLVTFRNKHGLDLKFERNKQYYARTIVKARADIQREETEQNIATAAELSGTPYAENAETIKCHLADFIRVSRILHVIKWEKENPSYEIRLLKEPNDTTEEQVAFKTYEEFTTFRLFANVIGKNLNIRIPKVPPKTWDKVADMLLNKQVLEERDVSEESKDSTRLAKWLREYLEEYPPAPPSVSFANKDPMLFQEQVFIFTSSFQSWVASIEFGSFISVPDLNLMLVKIGCQQDRKQPTVNGVQKNATVIRIPEHLQK